MQRYSKNKDLSPIDTINKIKGILNNINVIPTEAPWIEIRNQNDVQSVFVKRLYYCDETIGSNGKGTSKEYCLASAYAEFIERLQNLSLTKGLDVKIPDKKSFSQEDFINGKANLADEKFFRYLYSNTGIIDNNDISLADIIQKLQNFVKSDSDTDLDCVPFYEVRSNKIKYLPIDILTQVNTTNGMSAGNTPQEAIMQGICEIIERYVQKNIYLRQLNCPVIEEQEYINYEDIAKIISFYKKIGIKIQVRDASLGEGWPAVCVVFINPVGKYTMKYAASMNFPVAIERCLTEFAQCQDLVNNQYSLPHFSIIEEKEFLELEEVSKINVFNTHCFPFSNTFFTSDNYDWNYDRGIWNNIEDNALNLKNLIKIILDHSFDTYIRDVSFLGFPSYHIHIPEMSNFLINVVKDLENQLVAIKPYFEKYIDNFNLRYAIPYIFSFYHEITLAISLFNKNYEKALKEINKLLGISADSRAIPVLNCIQQYIKLKKENCAEKQIYDTLNMFFGEQITNHFYNYCINSNYIENVAQAISKNVNAHSKTEIRQKIQAMEKVLSDKLTSKYNENTPDQSLLSALFY